MLSTSIEPALQPVLACGHEIERLVLNLVVNARDALPDGGTIRIAGER